MAPPRGRRKKATASPKKAAIVTQDDAVSAELTSDNAVPPVCT